MNWPISVVTIRTYIGSIERGERNATLATVEAFAVAFNVPPHSLLAEPYE
jgi:transcriptional regulator with XRE-family HTH domain